MPRARRVRRPGAAQAGFSLVEMLVTLAVTALLVVGILGVFDFNNKVTHVQTQVADMQQSLRVGQYEMVRYVRMAGRGGVPADKAVEIRDNVGEVGAQGTILVGQDSPAIVRGSDVVTVRGVLSSPVYQIDYVRPDDFKVNDLGVGTGKILVRDPGPTGVPQDLTAIKEMLGLTDPPVKTKEPLILVSPLTDSILAVVELELEGSSVVTQDTPTGPVTTATLRFRYSGGTNTDQYAALTGRGLVFPLTNVGSLGILEEYRFYLRDERPPAGAAGSALAPKLSIARVFPGTQVAYKGNDSNLKLDLSDNILDLQVALGIDRDNDGQILGPPTAAAANEWLFDDAADVAFLGDLAYVRLNTLARTDRPDNRYQAPAILPVEDRTYKTTGGDLNDPASLERFYRRRNLQTIVDLRNLG